MARKKKLAVLSVIALLSIGGGVAYALWSANGTGQGRARTTTAVDVVVSPVNGAQDLYPGATGGDVYFTLDNDNPYPVTFTAMTAGTVTSSNPTACPAGNISVAGKTGLNLQVAADTTTEPVSITDVVGMATAAPDGCQGVSFDISLTLTGTQS